MTTPVRSHAVFFPPVKMLKIQPPEMLVRLWRRSSKIASRVSPIWTAAAQQPRPPEDPRSSVGGGVGGGRTPDGDVVLAL